MNIRVDLCLKLYPAGAAQRQLRVRVGQHEAALGEAVQCGGLQPPGAELVHILQHSDVGPNQDLIQYQYIYSSTSSSWPEVVSYDQDHIFLLCTIGRQWIKCQENEKKYHFHFLPHHLNIYFNFPR